MQGTTLKQNAYGTLVLSEIHSETIDQLVSLPWRAVVLRYFEEEIRTVSQRAEDTRSDSNTLCDNRVTTEVRLVHDRTDTRGIRSGRKKKIEVRKGVLNDEYERSDNPRKNSSYCFIRFMIEQISVPALSTCVKMLREGDERAKALLLLALLDIHQSKSMRVNMKESVELEPMKKIDEIMRFSNKKKNLWEHYRSPVSTVDRSRRSHTVTYPES